MVQLWAQCSLLWVGLESVVALCLIWPSAAQLLPAIAVGNVATDSWCFPSCQSAVEHNEMDHHPSAAHRQRAQSLILQVEVPRAVIRRGRRLRWHNSKLDIAKTAVLGEGVGI
jgi:hypothetical protein